MTTRLAPSPRTDWNPSPLVVHVPANMGWSDEQLWRVVQANPDLRIERLAAGEVLFMSPTGGETGEQNAELTMQLRQWAKQDGTGATFDSSTGFRLPNGAVRSPDAAWVSHGRLAALSADQRRGFIPLCPELVIELRSASDNLATLQDKMAEYMANGAHLGWLLDSAEQTVYVYRPQQPVQRLQQVATLSADPLLPRFTLDLRELWG